VGENTITATLKGKKKRQDKKEWFYEKEEVNDVQKRMILLDVSESI